MMCRDFLENHHSDIRFVLNNTLTSTVPRQSNLNHMLYLSRGLFNLYGHAGLIDLGAFAGGNGRKISNMLATQIAGAEATPEDRTSDYLDARNIYIINTISSGANSLCRLLYYLTGYFPMQLTPNSKESELARRKGGDLFSVKLGQNGLFSQEELETIAEGICVFCIRDPISLLIEHYYNLLNHIPTWLATENSESIKQYYYMKRVLYSEKLPIDLHVLQEYRGEFPDPMYKEFCATINLDGNYFAPWLGLQDMMKLVGKGKIAYFLPYNSLCLEPERVLVEISRVIKTYFQKPSENWRTPACGSIRLSGICFDFLQDEMLSVFNFSSWLENKGLHIGLKSRVIDAREYLKERTILRLIDRYKSIYSMLNALNSICTSI